MNKKKGLNNLIFSTGFQMLKIWFFEMDLNTCEIRSNGIKIAFFPKICSGWGFAPRSPQPPEAAGSPPDPHL